MKPTQAFDVTGFIINYETGDIGKDELLEGFAYLIKRGTITGLQGSYGRQAAHLIEQGYITPEGEITDKGRDA